MKRETIKEVLFFVLLVACAAQLRVVLQFHQNIAPVAAVALFAGFFFRSWRLAVLAPLTVMLISDWQIGGYDTRMMVVVYGCLLLPVTARGFLRRSLSPTTASKYPVTTAVSGVVGCTFAASLAFFVFTNLAAWCWSGIYEHTSADLARCFVQALPFFRGTVAGNLAFTAVLFGGHAALRQVWLTREARGLAASQG